MSVSTAERFLRTQPKPHGHGCSATTPGPLSLFQIPVCLEAPWEKDRPGFVEVDLVAHGGNTLEGSFLYTMTLTDLATGWTECIPLFTKSADPLPSANCLRNGARSSGTAHASHRRQKPGTLADQRRFPGCRSRS